MASFCPNYKLRCTLYGHSGDVRAVYHTQKPSDAILSGSRDKLIKLWSPDSGSNGFTNVMDFSGPTNYVSSLCCFAASEKYPDGLIIVGSNDSCIYCFTIHSRDPIFKLAGHTGNVCSLAAGKFGTLISGSWDKSAKVWLDQKVIMTLSGHEAAVWAVNIMPELGVILTGSADKLIKMWKAGKCEHTFEGHTDCVRCIAVLNSEEFLSCSNDATIRRWSANSLECRQVYYGHTNFIYSICVIPNSGGMMFASSSEDRSLRLWNVASTSSAENFQTITLPTQTAWSVNCLENGDIVVGSNDGVVRVFTQQQALQASPEEQKQLEAEVEKFLIGSQDLGDLKVSDLPSKEALYEPGKKDGHTKMIRDGGTVTAYQWSASENEWKKIGDVVGANDASKSTGDKTMHNGKEYDYVFSVDIEDGKPPLKLPYNINEDPWFAAQKFVTGNNLPPVYLEQVANFIIQNAKGVTLTQGSPAAVSDPFTGSGRYVPGYTNSANVTSGGVDPFTGNSCYATSQNVNKNNFFPQETYVKFSAANLDGIFNKLKEFNLKMKECTRIPDSDFHSLHKVMQSKGKLNENHILLVEKALKWPQEMIFPLLDVLRLAMNNTETLQYVCEIRGIEFIEFLISFLNSSELVSNQVLILKTICNLFANISEDLLLESKDLVISATLQKFNQRNLNKNIQISISTLLMNFAILIRRKSNIESKAQLISALVTIIDNLTDPEAIFRLSVCIGTLIFGDTQAIGSAKSFDLAIPLKKFSQIIDPTKVGECAALLVKLLN